MSFRFVVKFHYGHVALLIVKVDYQNNRYQIVKRQIHVKKQSLQVLKKYIQKIDIKL